MKIIFQILGVALVAFIIYKIGKRNEAKRKEQYMKTIHRDLFKEEDNVPPLPHAHEERDSQPMHFDLLEDEGEPIKPVPSFSQSGKIKVVIGSGSSNAPVQSLRYFCIKDKGYHVSVWPKDQRIEEYLEFTIAGLNHLDDIDNYLGEFVGTLEPEPNNPYDQNAIKILSPDAHHVGYVPKDQTQYVREFTTLPCSCFCYIGCNGGYYFSDCYIVSKKL